MPETSIRVCGVPIVGRSIAGQESFYRLPTMRSALEIGRCPGSLVPVANVFVTHAHLDHAAGIASYASQRTLQGLENGRAFLPQEAYDGFRRILEIHASLEGVERYSCQLQGVAPGDRIPLRHDLVVEVFPGSHRVPCVGYLFCERRHKLKPEFAGLAGSELARLREKGAEVAVSADTPMLAYPGDCDAGIFDVAPQILGARVLLIECTFLRPGEEDRARRYRHIHISDIAARAKEFRNEAIVLTHFSARYPRAEIEERVAHLPDELRDRISILI